MFICIREKCSSRRNG